LRPPRIASQMVPRRTTGSDGRLATMR
jgi:hypothetical protein